MTVLLRVARIKKGNIFYSADDLRALREKGKGKKEIVDTRLGKNINLICMRLNSYMFLYHAFAPVPIRLLMCLVRVIESETSKQPGRRSTRGGKYEIRFQEF